MKNYYTVVKKNYYKHNFQKSGMMYMTHLLRQLLKLDEKNEYPLWDIHCRSNIGLRQLKEQLRRNSASQPSLLHDNPIWSPTAHHSHQVSHTNTGPVTPFNQSSTHTVEWPESSGTGTCQQTVSAKRAKQWLGTLLLKGTGVTCQDHMETKHQLQGIYENYLSGYLHSKPDGSKVSLLPLCCSSVVNKYSPEVFWLLNILNCRPK